jgi:hypothetical protein
MARFDTAFDAAGIEPTAAYEILPAGKYRAQIVESEMRVTKNGMGKYLWLMLDILEGPQQGRKVFDQLNLVNANPTTVEIAQRTLSAIFHATEMALEPSRVMQRRLRRLGIFRRRKRGPVRHAGARAVSLASSSSRIRRLSSSARGLEKRARRR